MYKENINIKTNIIYIFIYVIKSSSITNSVWVIAATFIVVYYSEITIILLYLVQILTSDSKAW